SRVRNSKWPPSSRNTVAAQSLPPQQSWPPFPCTPVYMSCALAPEKEATTRAPPKAAPNNVFIISTAPVGGRRSIVSFDAIAPHADRPLERPDSSPKPQFLPARTSKYHADKKR